MVADTWCEATWYVIYPVALLPRLEPGSLDRSESQRSPGCMRRGMPLRERLGRQVVRRRPRDCCYYHGVNWRRVASVAVRIAYEVPLATQWDPPDDCSEADRAHELAGACGLPEREREAVRDLLNPVTGIDLGHIGRSLGYANGQHRAHALMSAGVRWVPAIWEHCCRETLDCSPWWCRLRAWPLPAAHVPGCDLA